MKTATMPFGAIVQSDDEAPVISKPELRAASSGQAGGRAERHENHEPAARIYRDLPVIFEAADFASGDIRVLWDTS
jgi:hypothetical protein